MDILHLLFHFIIIIIIISNLTIYSSSLATNSTSCLPQNCGNGPNITFPFWIPQQQQPSCGSPQFNITCKNHNPTVSISNQDYVVKDIFHNNYSFALASLDALNESNLCPTPRRNFSLHGTPFHYSDLSVDLFFYYNCSSPYADKTYSVDCASNGTGFSSFAVFHTEMLEKHNYSIDHVRVWFMYLFMLMDLKCCCMNLILMF
ncbi:hypothetical protein SSX86_016649 [Deinandra increscens subsp. villosa]|uniref:Wall-associated receptor kinase galacturonan-binding domain-containing protein n=1 Tax=Deinandra increscens subsp. villosa TaxID=3103831 RepID=A0AAP0GXF0_9ASTR